jgi:hypothetical protein
MKKLNSLYAILIGFAYGIAGWIAFGLVVFVNTKLTTKVTHPDASTTSRTINEIPSLTYVVCYLGLAIFILIRMSKSQNKIVIFSSIFGMIAALLTPILFIAWLSYVMD